jgi:hypothetical protein
MNRFKIVRKEVLNPTTNKQVSCLYVVDVISNKKFRCLAKGLTDAQIVANKQACLDSIVFIETEYGVVASIDWRPNGKYVVLA